MNNEIPQIDLSEYEFIEAIGEGSYAMVYLVKHKATGKPYAAKEMKKLYDSEKNQEFSKELNSYSRVKGPSILKIYGYSLTNFQGYNFPVIITEYMENSSLDTFFKENTTTLNPKKLTSKQKYLILLGIALGMKTIHEQSIIHRDLKPGNILLDSNYYPYICDFGISFISDISASQILMNSQVGTPLYQAPEILSDEPYTNKVDIFSYSLIAYQLITNQAPYEVNTTPFRLQMDILKGKRPDTTIIEDEQITTFLESTWSETPVKRPSFDLITEELLTDRYLNYFGITNEEVDSYLDLFNDSIKQRFSSSSFLRNLLQKARKGDADSMFNLAVLYDGGDAGIKIDKKKASEFYRQACENGSSDAMLIYGRKLLRGDGFDTDKKEAARIYKMFADKGNIKAMNNYGLMLFYGNGIDQNKEEAAVYLKKSADSGNPKAMVKYGEMLLNGDGVPRNEKLAAFYFKLAADQGIPDAMMCYVEMCKSEATVYYEKFASRGYVAAMYNLALLYLIGKDVPKNKKKAAHWMKMAADHGEIDAMFNYGVMLFNGDGIRTDKWDGSNYVKMAAEKGNEKAKQFCDEFIKNEEAKLIDHSDSNDDNDDHFTSPDLSQFCIVFRRLASPIYWDVPKLLNINIINRNVPEKASILWYDGLFSLDKYHDYLPTKHVNKIPGILQICYKSNLFKCLLDLKEKYPSVLKNTFPQTFIMPEQIDQFREYAHRPDINSKLWVNKNDVQSKRGITLIEDPDNFEPGVNTTIQPFISPYLIDGYKFDIRVFVLITNLRPFTMFIYRDCFAYFCSSPFTSPTSENRDSYVFKKKPSPGSTFMSIRSARNILRDISSRNKSIWKEIQRISALAVLSIYKQLRGKAIEACKINDEKYDIDDNSKINPLHRFFNLLGIDFLIDADKNPLIIGINDNPGMRAINDYDHHSKIELVKSEMNLIAAIIKNPKAEVRSWKKILPSKDISVKNIADNIMNEISDTESPLRRSMRRLPSISVISNDDSD